MNMCGSHSPTGVLYAGSSCPTYVGSGPRAHLRRHGHMQRLQRGRMQPLARHYLCWARQQLHAPQKSTCGVLRAHHRQHSQQPWPRRAVKAAVSPLVDLLSNQGARLTTAAQMAWQQVTLSASRGCSRPWCWPDMSRLLACAGHTTRRHSRGCHLRQWP